MWRCGMIGETSLAAILLCACTSYSFSNDIDMKLEHFEMDCG